MIKYFKSLGKSFVQGGYSIAEGMSKLNLFPPKRTLQDLLEQYPFEDDYGSIKSDWEAVGNDIRKAMNDYSKNLDQKPANH